ncbi:MAG TPA: lipopolysaccharide heptosyltransferase II [Bryobacteraceae bacterium]
MEFRNIFVRATNWVGDAVMAVPALQALRQEFPQARISILARPWVAGLYAREPFCDELLPYDLPRGWRGLRAKFDFARELRHRQFDCAILFPNSLEVAALAWAARIPVRIGYARDGRSALLTHAMERPKPGETPRHQRFYYLELLRRAGVIANYQTNSPIRFSGARLAAEQGRARFAAAGVAGAVIGISPGAAYGGAKRWLPERFAEAAIGLAGEREATVAVFGAPNERGVCERVREAIARAGLACLDFSGATSIAEFTELAAACELFLTNDSGPMHIASALGVPTVAVFGATDNEATGPTGEASRVVREPVECSPCLLRECPIDHRCMKRVTAQQVVEAAHELIALKR